MSKGFIFSMDALFAATIVILLTASLYVYTVQGFDGGLLASEWMTKKVLDAKTVGFYTHQGAGAFESVEPAPTDSTQRAMFCDYYFSYFGEVREEHFCIGG